MAIHLCQHDQSAEDPFALPSRLSPRLARIRDYWASLLRGGAEMPFADDLRPPDMPDMVHRTLLIDVFERPARFRIQSLGMALGPDALNGRFLDDVRLQPPLDFLPAQCSATVEAAAPTFFRSDAERPHARLLLPFWGDGRISLLLGAIDFA